MMPSEKGFTAKEGAYSYRCCVYEYGQGIYALNLTDEMGVPRDSAHHLPHALAEFLKRNSDLSLLSAARSDGSHPALLVATANRSA